jgi:DNA-binding MarR family transcriptional regulator
VSTPPVTNLGDHLREPFLAMVDHIHRRLAERGHPDIRPAHGNVFQFIDREGTRVSELAARARITKQSMGELVAHLEAAGYVERAADPTDRRARLIRLTERGWEAYPIAREAIAEVEAGWTARLGAAKMRRLRALLGELNEAL